MWREIKKVIQQHQHFILTTHINPDGDGVGAACALTELLLQQGKKVKFVCEGMIPPRFAFLDYHGTHEVYKNNSSYDDIDVVIVLDTHKKERIGKVSELIDSGKPAICIDHHEGAEPFTLLAAVDPHSCSVGAMIYTLYKESGFNLNINAATGIYTSVICDTGRFSYSSTTRKAHKIADECIKLGVDPDLMHTRLFQHIPLMQIRLFAKALEKMEMHFSNKVLVQEIRLEDCLQLAREGLKLENLDLEYMHEFSKSIEEVECVVLLRELEKNRVRVSLRSKSQLDVCQIVKGIGGGGHSKAAGVTLGGSLQVVKYQILKIIDPLFRDLQDTERLQTTA